MPAIEVYPGRAYPLGASYDGEGVNFSIFSAHAQKVELCLFDKTGTQETLRIAITENEHSIWHTYVQELNRGKSTVTESTALINHWKVKDLILINCFWIRMPKK